MRGLVVSIRPDLGDGWKMHVRRERDNGLWDSQDLIVGGAGDEGDVDRLVAKLPEIIAALRAIPEDRNEEAEARS